MKHDKVTVTTTVKIKRDDGSEHTISATRERSSSDPLPLVVEHLTTMNGADLYDSTVKLEAQLTG